MRLFIVAALVAVACADHHMSGDMQHGHDMGDMDDMMHGMSMEDMKKMIMMKEKMTDMMMKMMMKKMMKEGMQSMDMSNKTMTDHIRAMHKMKVHMMMHKMNITFDLMDTMEKMDADKDGSLTWEEYKNSQMALDADKDGMVNTTEWVGPSMYAGWTMRSALYIFFRLENGTDSNLDEKEFEMAFNGMDMNNDKKVELMEFGMATAMMITAMAKHHMRAGGVMKIFNVSDADMDGELTEKELMDGALMWDEDKDGSLSEMEFVTGWVMATNSTIKEAKMFFAMLDRLATEDKMFSSDDMKVFFVYMDYDRDGMATMDEFLNLMVFYGARIDEMLMTMVAEKFMKVDTNTDGVITFTEAEDAMKPWDMNNDGMLNYTEFIGGAVASGGEETAALYSFFIADNNTNGQLEHDEFRQVYIHADMDMDKKMTFMEYAHHKHEMAMQLDQAMKIKPALEKGFNDADADMDGSLAEAELMKSFRDNSPANGLTKEQYIGFWRNMSHMGQHEAEILFKMVDYSTMDDMYDERDEKKYFENGDVNKDGIMTKKEYFDQWLWYWARINVEMAKMKMMHLHKMMKGLMHTKLHHMMMHKKIHMAMEHMNITFNGTATFMALDTDNDMYISEEEYLGAQMQMDTDGDKMVNVSEYVVAAGYGGWPVSASLYLFHRSDNNSDQTLNEDEIKMTFKGMDANNNGKVCAMEFAQTIAMSVMAMGYHHKKSDALKAMFNRDDINNDGMWSIDEFKTAVGSMDKNGDKKVNEDEFLVGWIMATNSTIKATRLFFHMLDDGTKDGNLTEKDAENVFAGMDYEKDDMVTMEEFMNTMVFFAAKIDNEMMMKAHKSFMMMDTNMDGEICTKEFHDHAKSMDMDGDMKLNYTEVVGGAMAKGSTRGEALYSFFMTDNNTDGYLDKMEMLKTFMHVDMDMSMRISMMEYAHHKHEMGMQLDKAEKLVPVLTALIKPADTDGDEMVTEAELLASYKLNGQTGSFTEDEFVARWMNVTRMDKKSSHIFFHLVDYSTMDHTFDEADQKKWFSGADYNSDGMMSLQEYLDSMLYFWSQINKKLGMEMMEKMKHKMMIMAVAGMFDGKAAYNMVDADGSGDVDKTEFDGLYTKMSAGNSDVSDVQFVGSFMKMKMPEGAALYIFFRTDENEDNMIDSAERDSAFKAFDADMDGKVTMKEYHNVMMKMMGQYAMLKMRVPQFNMRIYNALDDNLNDMLTAEEMKLVIPHMDKDGDGMVSEDEFAMVWTWGTGASDEDARSLFGYMDGDDDGFFGNDLELSSLFKGYDYNNDNMVSKKEFHEGLLFFAARIQDEKDMAEMMAKTMKDAVVGFFY